MNTLFTCDFEQGNFKQLDSIAPSGINNYFVQSEIVHSGNYAAKLIIQPNWLFGKAAVRLAWMNRDGASPDDPKNLPDAAYYSAWYYLPSYVETPWLNLMQWKGWLPNGERAPIAAVRLLGKDGRMTLNLRTRADEYGEFIEDGPVIAGNPTPLPVDEWFEIKTFYKHGNDGEIWAWLNDDLLWQVWSISTEFAYAPGPYPRQWTVNNYAGKTKPGKYGLYVDDLRVWTE